MSQNSHLLTVYFDTSFFVKLLRSGAAESRMVIDGLNDLRVRYVKSPTVYSELARGRGEGDSVLLERLAWFENEPLHLSSMLAVPGDDAWVAEWTPLAVPEGREDLAQTHLEIGRLESYSGAISAAAGSNRSQEPLLDALFGDFPDLIESIHAGDPDSVSDTVNNLLRRKAPWVSEIPSAGDVFLNMESVLKIGFDALQGAGIGPLPSLDLVWRDPEKFLKMLGELLGPRNLRLAETKDELRVFQEKSDGRSIKAVGESMSARSRERFESSQRDFDHMSNFVVFEDQIDLLQVDGPRLREIMNNKEHPMRRWGLHNRCFYSEFLDMRRAIERCWSARSTSNLGDDSS